MANVIQAFPTGAGGGSDIQVTSLPTASASELGNIYQFVGTTTANTVNGYFYKCVSDGESTPTYSWEECPTETAETVEISKTDFDNLSQAEKDNGQAYFIPDADIVGTFTVLGNRFDKANIYTSDERMIGSWMGKPLYQKTVDCGALPNNNDKQVAIGTDLSVDRVISIEGYSYKAENNIIIPLPYVRGDALNRLILIDIRDVDTTSPKIQIGTKMDYSPYTETYITVKYTKTSDGTVIVGTGNDYSTNEQVIGTWIDGRKLYQKTVATGALPNNTTKSIAHGVSNIEKVVNAFGYFKKSTLETSMFFNHPYTSFINVTVDFTNIIIKSNTNVTTYDESYVTIQYVKTSD